MSLFIVGLDSTIVNVALPSIGRELHASVSGLQWTIAAYTLVLASLLMLSGSTADRIGRRRTFQAGLAVFTAGLRNRLYRAGVLVTTVKPGFIDTAMTWGLPGLFLVASPEAAARAILAAALKGREIVYVPRFWALIMLIIRLIPERIFKRLSI